MDQIKSLHTSHGSAISSVLQPTFKIWTPLLLQNKTSILSTPRTKHSYGPHPRQKLDIYPAIPSSQSQSPSPYLIFLYGGGLVHGSKILPVIPEGLVYHNVGSFFAQRGFTTIIADYRLVDSSEGGHGAVYPSGAEDISLVLEFLGKIDEGRKRDVFIMGNSAGGLHLGTFLLDQRFLDVRKGLLGGEAALVWKGAVEVGVPFHFGAAGKERNGMLRNYYGDEEEVREKAPLGLLNVLGKEGKSREEAHVPRVLVLESEFDPEEITKPTKDFVELWKKAWNDRIELWTMEGHNHISPTGALMTGDKEGEKWGEDVVRWMNNLSS